MPHRRAWHPDKSEWLSRGLSRLGSIARTFRNLVSLCGTWPEGLADILRAEELSRNLEDRESVMILLKSVHALFGLVGLIKFLLSLLKSLINFKVKSKLNFD